MSPDWPRVRPVRQSASRAADARRPLPAPRPQPGDVDFVVVRENTEGEYSSVGGRVFSGTARNFVVQQAVFTRAGVDRILEFAFELARSRPKKHLTSCTKSNGISISMPFWDAGRGGGSRYPDVRSTGSTSTS